jgi:hypothetical protein
MLKEDGRSRSDCSDVLEVIALDVDMLVDNIPVGVECTCKGGVETNRWSLERVEESRWFAYLTGG